MRRLVVALAVVAVVASTLPVGVSAQAGEPVDCTFPVALTDATGGTVTVESEPDRVVALASSAAQTMWEIGAEETVVGMPVNAYTAYLNGSGERQSIVGEDGDIVTERALALETEVLDETTAVREGQIVRPNVNYLNQPGPRNTIPLRQFARAFHPDAAGDIDVDDGDLPPIRRCADATADAAGTTGAAGTATATPSDDASEAGTRSGATPVTPTETAGGAGTGFGPVIAAAALVVTALLARRR